MEFLFQRLVARRRRGYFTVGSSNLRADAAKQELDVGRVWCRADKARNDDRFPGVGGGVERRPRHNAGLAGSRRSDNDERLCCAVGEVVAQPGEQQLAPEEVSRPLAREPLLLVDLAVDGRPLCFLAQLAFDDCAQVGFNPPGERIEIGAGVFALTIVVPEVPRAEPRREIPLQAGEHLPVGGRLDRLIRVERRPPHVAEEGRRVFGVAAQSLDDLEVCRRTTIGDAPVIAFRKRGGQRAR